MSGKFVSLITRYEEDIKLHDCQQWEKELEDDPILDISDATRRKTRRKMELLDVDLVRGSTFPKSKTRHDLKSILCYSVISVLLFPLRSSWWIRKSSIHCYILGSFVYTCSLFNVYLYHHYLCQEPGDTCSKVNLHEVYEPILLFIVLALLQCHIVSPLKYRNMDILDNTKVRDRSVSSSTSLGSCQRRKSSISAAERTSSRSNSAVGRNYQKVRKLSLRRNIHPSNILDSWHENSTSCTDNEDHETSNTTTQCHRDNRSDSFMKQVRQNTVQSSDDQQSETIGSENNPRRKLSKQRLYGKDSEAVSSSAEDSHSKQSSPIVLQIGCTIWNGCEAPSKVYMSALQIGNQIFERSKDTPDSLEYTLMGLFCAVFIALLPLVFKYEDIGELHQLFVTSSFPYNLPIPGLMNERHDNVTEFCTDKEIPFETILYAVIIFTSAAMRLMLTITFFVLLAVGERAFKRRFLTAKLFSHITSTRKSSKSQIPHFRLCKVRNIKAWLCVRAFLRKRGPQRSIDCIVSTAFMFTLINVCWLCYQLLKDDDVNPEVNVTNCAVISWCVSIGFFLVRYMTLASRINQKYRNLSVLLTEQINLYLQMEQKPHKKEQLQLANNVLKLSSDLLKELETPFKINGLSANPFLYNCTRVLVLSAVSGVLSEMLGFKLKLYKVKLR